MNQKKKKLTRDMCSLDILSETLLKKRIAEKKELICSRSDLIKKFL